MFAKSMFLEITKNRTPTVVVFYQMVASCSFREEKNQITRCSYFCNVSSSCYCTLCIINPLFHSRMYIGTYTRSHHRRHVNLSRCCCEQIYIYMRISVCTHPTDPSYYWTRKGVNYYRIRDGYTMFVRSITRPYRSQRPQQ